MESISFCTVKAVTGAEVDTWLGYHGYLLSIASFVNRLVCCYYGTYPPMKQ